MRAIVYTEYGSPDVLQLKEVKKPAPKENEVLIRVYASTVTAVDCTFRKGDSLFARLFTGILKPKNNIPGADLAGKIETIGKNVKRFKVGDRIFGSSSKGFYTNAEFLCLSEEEALTIMPDKMTFEEAASIPYGGLTALPFLRDKGNIQKGQKVLINGASGSIGTFAIQLSKYYGAEVTGVCSNANLELIKSLGADKVIDYTKEDFTKRGETYDIIFDTIGKSSFLSCKSSLKRQGIYLTTVLSLTILRQMLLTSKMGTQKAIIAFTGLRKAGEKEKDLIFLKELIEDGKIKPVMDKYYPFEHIAEAHKYVEKGHKRGTVVITP